MDVYSWFRRRNQKSAIPISNSGSNTRNSNNGKEEEEERFYGITEQLIEFVKTFTIDTFKNFYVPDEEEGGIRGDDGISGNVRNDLSDWQERHAMLILSKVKELAQLRFRLCPGFLKEQQFWRIYFTLVWTYVAEYELHAVRLAKLKQMRAENETQTESSAVEVEMSEAKAKPATPLGPAVSLE